MRLHCYYFIILCLFFKDLTLVLEILACLLRENMCDISCKSKVDKISVIVVVLHVKDRNDDDNVTSVSVYMQMHRGSHHLADIHFSGNAFVRNVCMLRTDAKCDRLALNIVLQQAGCLFLIELNLYTAERYKELVALALKLCIEEIHDGHADEPCDKEV